jgi:hypothetical protein
MSNRTLTLTDTLYDYVLTHWLREHPAQTALRDATRGHERATMQIAGARPVHGARWSN